MSNDKAITEAEFMFAEPGEYVVKVPTRHGVVLRTRVKYPAGIDPLKECEEALGLESGALERYIRANRPPGLFD
jgi:hypothetical protein